MSYNKDLIFEDITDTHYAAVVSEERPERLVTKSAYNTKADSLLSSLFYIMKRVVEADSEGLKEVTMDFLKYNRFDDVSINRAVQDFLFQGGFSISTEQLGGSHLNLKVRWHSKDTILGLVHFVISSFNEEEIFK